jgi:hypothetical protein
LTCRVESISPSSKQAPRIFHTSPEHPNARIIITPPYADRRTQPAGDIFDPQLPSKRRVSNAVSDDNARRSSRKRTLIGKYDEGSSDTDSLLDEFTPSKSKKVKLSTTETKDAVVLPSEPRKRKSSAKLLENAEPNLPRKRETTGRPANPTRVNREREARLDRRENEELYEALQKQVTIDLLKRRYTLLRLY